MARHLPVAAAVLAVAAALGWLQTRSGQLVDRDSLFHARAAQTLPDRGLSRSFEWTQESLWRDRYSDKEFLFHLALAPFCRGADPAAGAKAAAWLFGAAIVAVVALVLVRNGIRLPWLWVLLVAALGNHFLFRMQSVRPQLLSILLLLLGVDALLRDRRRTLFVVGFLYSWSYAAPQLLVVFAALQALAAWIIDRRFDGRALAAASAGVAAGMILHPYFPNNLEQWWILNVRIMSGAWLGPEAGVRLGAEFDPVTTRSLVDASTLVLLCLVGSLAAPAFSPGALSRRSRLLIVFELAGFFLYLMSARFIEYFAPLALLAVASVAGDLLPPFPWSGRSRVVAAVAGALLLAIGIRSLADTNRALSTYPAPDLAGSARWIAAKVPPGETIVHLDWNDFTQLYYFDPGHRYLVGLDPMFMQARSPERQRLLEETRSGRRPFDAEELARTFGSRTLVVRSRLRRIVEEAGLTPLYADDGGAVYPLR